MNSLFYLNFCFEFKDLVKTWVFFFSECDEIIVEISAQGRNLALTYMNELLVGVFSLQANIYCCQMYVKVSFSFYSSVGRMRISCHAQFLIVTTTCLYRRNTGTYWCVGAKSGFGMTFQSFQCLTTPPFRIAMLQVLLIIMVSKKTKIYRAKLHSGMMPLVEAEINIVYWAMIFCELCRNTSNSSKSTVIQLGF